MDKQTWHDALATLPQPQLLQTYPWGAVKAQFGWQPHYRLWQRDGQVQAAALVLERSIALPGMAAMLRMLYVPKGPLLRDWSDTAMRKKVVTDLIAFGKQRRAFLLKLEPDVLLGRGVPGRPEAEEGLVGEQFTTELRAGGWHFSDDQIQFRNTVLIDLTPNEDDLLAVMKQKTRYNIRLAGRRGVTVRQGSPLDFEMLYQMYAETAVRDGFTIRGREYYLAVWQAFYEDQMLVPLIAEVEGQAVAGLMLFMFGGTAWYIYGMSSGAHRKLMPTYLLQWEAIRRAKERGCQTYDLWGAPNVFDESDSLWGVYRFKAGLGGTVARHVGAWDLPLRPWLYKLYTKAVPRMLEVMRLRGDAQTRGNVT